MVLSRGEVSTAGAPISDSSGLAPLKRTTPWISPVSFASAIDPSLAANKVYNFVIMLGIFWGTILINLRGTAMTRSRSGGAASIRRHRRSKPGARTTRRAIAATPI